MQPLKVHDLIAVLKLHSEVVSFEFIGGFPTFAPIKLTVSAL